MELLLKANAPELLRGELVPLLTGDLAPFKLELVAVTMGAALLLGELVLVFPVLEGSLERESLLVSGVAEKALIRDPRPEELRMGDRLGEDVERTM